MLIFDDFINKFVCTRAPCNSYLIPTHFWLYFANYSESRFLKRSSTSFCLFTTFVFAQNRLHALTLFRIVLVMAPLVYRTFSYLIRFLIFQSSHLKICNIVFMNIHTHSSFSMTPTITISKLNFCCLYPFVCRVLFIFSSIFLSPL